MFVFENHLDVRRGYGEQVRNRLQSQRPADVPGMLGYEVFTKEQTASCEQICIRSVWASQRDFHAFMQRKDFQFTHCAKCLPYLMQYRIRFYSEDAAEFTH